MPLQAVETPIVRDHQPRYKSTSLRWGRRHYTTPSCSQVMSAGSAKGGSDGFRMARELLAHAVGHFQVVRAGLDEFVAGWETDKDGNPVARWVLRRGDRAAAGLLWEIELKHCLEDLRSALDYCAYEVYERICCEEPSAPRPHVHMNVRFPIPDYQESEKDFERRVLVDVPGLKKGGHPVVSTFVGFTRYARPGTSWLPVIDEKWQIVKHRHLTVPSTRSGKVVAVTGGSPEGFPAIKVRLFDTNPPSEVISTMTGALDGVREIIEELEKATISAQSPARASSPPPRGPG